MKYISTRGQSPAVGFGASAAFGGGWASQPASDRAASDAKMCRITSLRLFAEHNAYPPRRASEL